MTLRHLVKTWKSIAVDVAWTTPDPGDRYTRFYSPLEINGIIDSGLVLKGGTYSNQPNVHVTFELAISNPRNGKYTRLVRIDWRDLKGGHSNNRKLCSGIISRTAATHLHDFDLNYIEAEDRMRKGGKLPCAINVTEDLQTFEELRTFVGRHFRINNIDVVPPPNWEYTLF